MSGSMLDAIKGQLVVSCQALEDEPLYSDFIMSRMALAAQQGGAAAIRANSVADIQAIKRVVPLPIIGILKRDYPGSQVYITATLGEVDELMTADPDMIALDATGQPRPDGVPLAELVQMIRRRYPNLLLMADIATPVEAQTAARLGFDCIGTTLHGYTNETYGRQLPAKDFAFLREVLAAVDKPVIAEGNITTPAMMARCLQLGAHAVVVGGAITRPKQITERFVAALPVKHRGK